MNWMTTVEVAEFLGMKPQTIRKWRCIALGPRFYRHHGNTVRYRREDVERWLQDAWHRSAA